MTMITPSYLGETIEYSSLHACRSTLEDPTQLFYTDTLATEEFHEALRKQRGVPAAMVNHAAAGAQT